MCRVMCPTTLPLASEVTRRLLSQCPPLKSSFPSGDTASVRELRSAPGAKGPCRKRWVLAGRGMMVDWWHLQGPSLRTLCPSDSLGVGDSGVFGEAEVVGDVLVVGQPVMGPQQAVGTHGDLGREARGGDTAPTAGVLPGLVLDPLGAAKRPRASVSPHSPGCRGIPE